MSSYLKITIPMIVGAAMGAVFYINNTSSAKEVATEAVIAVDFSNPVVQLKNTDGETINAELLALEGNTLTVRRDDGQTFTFDSSMLVDADQHYVAKHFEGRPEPKRQDGQPTTKEYIIPDSPEYLQSLYQELLDGAN